MSDTKKCTKCGKELPLDQFSKRKRKGDRIGYQSWCKGCNRLASSRQYRGNPEKKRVKSNEWRKNNPEKVRVNVSRWVKNNPEKARASNARWRKNNPDKCLANAYRWRNNSQAEYKAYLIRWHEANPGYSTNYTRERRSIDLNFKIAGNIRAAMGMAIRCNSKSGHTVELLGCSIEFLRVYLENQFMDGMTWDNYGRYGWHIDHVIPLSHFDMSDPKQQKRAWHYTNLQPLWAKENMSKGAKIIERQLVLL